MTKPTNADEAPPMRWGDQVRATRPNREPEVTDWADLVLCAEEGCFDGLTRRTGEVADPGGQRLESEDGRDWVQVERVQLAGAR